MTSVAVEDYLKAILQEGERLAEDAARIAPGKIAKNLGLTPGTVTTMFKHLAASGLIEYESRRGARLTDRGRTIAVGIQRRHRLLELFLTEILRYDASEVHDEAEHLEHAVSEQFIDRLDHLLDHPLFDPHGTPIPRKDGTLPMSESMPLSSAEPGFYQVVETVGSTHCLKAPLIKRFANIQVLKQSVESVLLQTRTGELSLDALTANQIVVRSSRCTLR